MAIALIDEIPTATEKQIIVNYPNLTQLICGRLPGLKWRQLFTRLRFPKEKLASLTPATSEVAAIVYQVLVNSGVLTAVNYNYIVST